MEFARNLKRIRTDKNMLQSELAEKTGVSQKAVSSWETGKTYPSIEDAYKMAEVLGCDVNDFDDRPTRNRNISTEELVNMILRMDNIKDVEEIRMAVEDRMKKFEEQRKFEKELLRKELAMQEMAERLEKYRIEVEKLRNLSGKYSPNSSNSALKPNNKSEGD